MTFSLNLLVLCLALTGINGNEVNILAQFGESNAKFATHLYSTVIEGLKGENVIMSPLSIQIAGSVLYTAAAGESAKELAEGLSLFVNDSDAVSLACKEVLEKNSNGHLKIANKIYVAKDVQIKDEFHKNIRLNFFSEEENVDFSKGIETAEIINNWVQNKTNNKIRKFFREDNFDKMTLMTLVNAIYFNAKWTFPFEATLTKTFWKAENESEEIDMMFLREEGLKYKTLDEFDAKAVQLDYVGTDASMIIILPNSRTGLDKLEEKLSQINLLDLQNNMMEDYVDLFLPKFNFETAINLKDILEQMGIKSIFDTEKVNLSNMIAGKNLIVNSAIHKAFINVTETGTEAGAATGFAAHDLTIPQRFLADHPFFFAIVSKTAVLYVGRYVK